MLKATSHGQPAFKRFIQPLPCNPNTPCPALTPPLPPQVARVPHYSDPRLIPGSQPLLLQFETLQRCHRQLRSQVHDLRSERRPRSQRHRQPRSEDLRGYQELRKEQRDSQLTADEEGSQLCGVCGGALEHLPHAGGVPADLRTGWDGHHHVLLWTHLDAPAGG